MAKDILAHFLEDTSGLRQSREHSLWHTVRLIFEAVCTGWCVPRVGYAEGKTLSGRGDR